MADTIDFCPGFNDNLDADNDSIPDDCDDLVDSDLDGIANDLDICEGFDDLIDSDGDEIPDGCDETPDGSEDTANTTNVNSDNVTNDGLDNSSQPINNNSDNLTLNENVSLNEVQSDKSASVITSQLILSFILMFSGAWLLVYLLIQRVFTTKEHDEQIKSDISFHESGIQDLTEQFAQASTMIDLPYLEPR